MTRDAKTRKKMAPALLTTVAALVTLGGCSQRNQAGQCVDQNGNILPDSACRGGGTYYSGGGGGYRYPHYVYGGSVSGGRVSGGSSAPSEGGGIFRGGFGFHGFGFHGGGG